MAGRLLLESSRSILKGLTQRGRGYDKVVDKLRVVAAADGQCTCEMVVNEDHLNAGGSLHGGMSATLVDVVSTLAIMNTGSGHPGVSVDINVTYVRPAMAGDNITIHSQCLKVGKSLASAVVDIKNQDDQLVCQGRQTKYVKSTK